MTTRSEIATTSTVHGDRSALEFVLRAERELLDCRLSEHPLLFACRRVARNRPGGLWLELGTGTGTSLRAMCGFRTEGKVYSFDSFEGIPEDWIPEYGVCKGAFAMPPPTNVPANAELVVGRFEDTLPPFLDAHPNCPIDLLHVDCDVYSSARLALAVLGDRLISGSVLVFDELLYYPGRELHEARALYEWLCETRYFARWIGIHGAERAVDLVERGQSDPRVVQESFMGPGNELISFDAPIMDRVAIELF